MLDFRIKTYLKLCETKSYTKTAEILHITQPSVTQHIKYLQKLYGCKLFSYEGKTLRLTPEGEYLRRQAETMSKTSSKITEDLKRMTKKNAVLRFGCSTALGERVVSKMVGKMMAEDEDLEMSYCTANTQELQKMLEYGKLDFILTDNSIKQQGFGEFVVGKSKFCGWASPSYADDLQGMSLKRMLREKVWIREEGSGTRKALSRALAKKGNDIDDFYMVMECNSPSSIQELTAEDAGITFAMECCMRDAVKQGRIRQIAISDLREELTLSFMYLNSSNYIDQFKPFLEKFKEEWIKLESENA